MAVWCSGTTFTVAYSVGVWYSGTVLLQLTMWEFGIAGPFLLDLTVWQYGIVAPVHSAAYNRPFSKPTALDLLSRCDVAIWQCSDRLHLGRKASLLLVFCCCLLVFPAVKPDLSFPSDS